jgi:hypothetical protein
MNPPTWQVPVHAQAAHSLCFTAEDVLRESQAAHGASISPPPHSYLPLTRSAAACHATTEATAALATAEAAEAEALREHAEPLSDIALNDHPALAFLHNLPERRMIPSDQVHETGMEPVLLFSYQYLLLCTACTNVYPTFARNMGYYLMRPFLGPKVDIPTHYKRPLPPPTTFYHVDNFRHSDPAMNATIYGHFIEGFYLTPLTVVHSMWYKWMVNPTSGSPLGSKAAMG